MDPIVLVAGRGSSTIFVSGEQPTIATRKKITNKLDGKSMCPA